jgi:putative ABC transport system permease protein
MTKFSGLRRRSGRAAAMVFASYESVCRDFQIDRVNFIWLDLAPAARIADLGAALQPLADRHLGERQPVNDQGTWAVGAAMFGSSLRISTREEVRQRIAQRADGMIWGMCQLPLVTLLISSLAVVNTVMASVRARRWEMGVLRAIGLTRSALVRLILAEAVLIGLAACLLSLAFGVMAGWCGTGVSQYVSFFGGLETPLVIPWAKIGLSFAGTLLLCLVAALWPALSTGRAEPLQLLQSGRGAM